MPDNNLSYNIAFFRAFQRPAWVVMMVSQMILGLALAITLVLKVYMIVFTSYVCEVNGTSLGNLIRCTGTLEIIAHYALTMAGFRFAAFMFQDRPRAVLGPLMIALVGIFLLFLSGLSLTAATWPAAATIVVLAAAMTIIVLGQAALSRAIKRDEDSKKET